MDEQQIKPTVWQKLKSFYAESVRVLKVTKKPTGEEFKTIVKISGLGIAVIGFIGFLVTLVQQYILK